MKWEKIFANHLPDKRLISNIQRSPKIQQQQKTNNLIQKWAKELIFVQRRHEWLISTQKNVQHH